MDENKNHQNEEVELNDDQQEEVSGGVISGGNGPLTSAFSGTGTNPGEVPPPVPPSSDPYAKDPTKDPNYGK